jgi:hypothetical protein
MTVRLPVPLLHAVHYTITRVVSLEFQSQREIVS